MDEMNQKTPTVSPTQQPEPVATPAQNTVEPSVSTSEKKEMPMWALALIGFACLAILGVGAYFSIKYSLGKLGSASSNVGSGISKSVNSSLESAEKGSFSSKAALAATRGYLEALYKGDYSSAYSYLDQDLALVDKTGWIKGNSEAGYKVVSYTLPETLSVFSSDLAVFKDKSLYDLGYGVTVKRKTVFADSYNSDAASMLVVWNKDKNTYKIVDRVAIIKPVDVNKTVVNTSIADKLSASFNLKKAYFTRNSVFFVWDYADNVLGTLPYISLYAKPVLIDVSTGNSIEYNAGNINSRDLLSSSYMRKTGATSNNSYDSFWLGESSKTDMEKTWNFTGLKLKYTPLFQVSNSSIFPDIEVSL